MERYWLTNFFTYSNNERGGTPFIFIKDITIIAPTPDSDFYWIARTKVETTKDLDKPYLKIHYNQTGKSVATRTVSGNGNLFMYIKIPEF